MSLVKINIRRADSQNGNQLARVVWDDENPDWNYRCRTQFKGYVGPDNPPAVNRFSDKPLAPGQPIGMEKVDISAWKNFFTWLNNDTTGQDFNYWTDPGKAQFNDTGWPMMMYVLMSGNVVRGQVEGEWFRFECFKPGDVSKAQGMTIHSHPHLIHRFTCVTWKDGETKRINSTGTPRGDIFFPVVTNEGYGYIRKRHVVLQVG